MGCILAGGFWRGFDVSRGRGALGLLRIGVVNGVRLRVAGAGLACLSDSPV
jgi:hypothetical protein